MNFRHDFAEMAREEFRNLGMSVPKDKALSGIATPYKLEYSILRTLFKRTFAETSLFTGVR